MARLTKDQWLIIRAEREATGASFRVLAERHGVSDVAILKKSREEGWRDGTDGNALANKLAKEKVSGIVSAANISARTKSIEEAADKKADVILAQQADWELHRAAYDVNGETEKERLQNAKLAAEVLKLRHEGERKAYSISDDEAPKQEAPKGLSDFYG